MKKKPTQMAQRQLNSVGLHADVIVARGPAALDSVRKEKLAMLCGVKKNNSISAPDVPSIYQLPVFLEKQDIGNKLLDALHLARRKSNLSAWQRLVSSMTCARREVKIAVV